MSKLLKKGDRGPEISELQQLLVDHGLQLVVDGVFGLKTHNAVRAFQTQNLDPDGRPLKVDGVVGPLTWWSLKNPKPDIEGMFSSNLKEMPPISSGGSKWGRFALGKALGEWKAGAREIGGNNKGPWVLKYLDGRAPEGSSWCSAFVSWCFAQNPDGMLFRYNLGARSLLNALDRKGWAQKKGNEYDPLPGDIVVWWRVSADGWQGHVGLVHHCRNGILYTIEGNKSSKVQGFSYVLSRMEKFLGYGHIPDET